MTQAKKQAWIVAADMGYGHQRAAFPLRYLAHGHVINANNYPGIPASDRKWWQEGRKIYEFISRFKGGTPVGDWIFDLYDKLQSIPAFYPRRDLSRPTLQVRQIEYLIKAKNWGKHLIDKLAEEPLPLVTSFFVPAFMADLHNYPEDIYCLVTDTDISRAWVTSKPAISKIKYFAPNYRVVERLRLYGVPADRIFLTGFPLPNENIGNEHLSILKEDIRQRLKNLDPRSRFWNQYTGVYRQYIHNSLPQKSNHPLTLTFAVGGAGAQRELGVTIMKGLRHKIQQGRLRLVLVAGIHNEVASYFRQQVLKQGLRHALQVGDVVIIHAQDKYQYFNKFNHILRTTDILWTKPSELSFYVALGIPLIMSQPIGSQEDFNRIWVETIGAGCDQQNPEFAEQWLFDLLDSGWLAQAAMQGFIEAPKFGTFNIEKIITRQYQEVKELKTVLQF
ncbi:MAG: hypothetical protein V1846_02255 [Candidatus Komeilibacteria bacterium]